MQPFCLRRTTIPPRLFQQTCRLASTQRRVVRPRTATALQKNSKREKRVKDEDEEEAEDSIKWFEKDVQTGAIRRVAGNPEEMEARELRQKIKALEAELKEYKSDASDEAIMAALEPEERAKYQRALQERQKNEKVLTAGLELSLELPPLSVPVLKRLNSSLRDAALNTTSVQHRKDLWRWYSRGKYSIPALARMVPPRAWDLLWETQSVQSPTNPERLQHISQLLADMISVGHPLTDEQSHVYLETLIDLGQTDLARQRWQHEYTSNQSTSRHRILELGVSLFIKTGDLDRAHQLLQEHLGTLPAGDPRIILTLIAANVQTGNDHMAFALYLLLRSKLGQDMTMDDYDAVALQFLNQNKKDLALTVFRDMMLQGKQAINSGFFDQKKRDKLYAAVTNRIDVLRSSATDEMEVNNISLSALSAMPHQWQNKYFYSSWLKKLIGMGQLDGASKVIELMYERGIEPDTKHLNGLIGAYFRSNSTDYHERGIALSWSMIQQRLDFAYDRREKKRDQALDTEAVISVRDTQEGDEAVEIPTFITRKVPRASIETFNVLVLHYTLRKMWQHVHHLHRMLRPAEIKPDSFFMNHVLQTQLYGRSPQAAWRQFVRTARTVPPDLETYRCLWTAELQNLDRHKTKDRSGFPMPRQLFSVMTTWLSSLDEKSAAVARGAFDEELYAKIMQSFCVEKDFAGALVVVHALAQRFGHFPDHNIAKLITTAVSNIPEALVPSIRGRRGRQQIPVSQARLKNTAKVLTALANRRATAAMEHGIDIEKLDPEARVEENLNLLSEFVRVVLVRSVGDPDTVEPSIERAAQEMGVPGISTGDVDASNVV